MVDIEKRGNGLKYRGKVDVMIKVGVGERVCKRNNYESFHNTLLGKCDSS